MGKIGKLDIGAVVKEMDARIDYDVQLIVVGSVSGIIGYGGAKINPLESLKIGRSHARNAELIYL